MKAMKTGLAMVTVGGLASAALLAGCLSSGALLERRIAAKQAAFQLLSADDQQRVRRGEVRVGDGQDFVWIARGQPSRIFRRETPLGTNTVWSYTRQRATTNRNLVPVTVWNRTSRGDMRPSTDYVWVDRDTTHEFESFRVEFHVGRVWAIEEVEPAP